MFVIFALTAIALGGLAVRTLYVGVCDHLEADDIPLEARPRFAEPRRTRRRLKPRRLPAPRVLAHAAPARHAR
jgi:hypothetical protein